MTAGGIQLPECSAAGLTPRTQDLHSVPVHWLCSSGQGGWEGYLSTLELVSFWEEDVDSWPSGRR